MGKTEQAFLTRERVGTENTSMQSNDGRQFRESADSRMNVVTNMKRTQQ